MVRISSCFLLSLILLCLEDTASGATNGYQWQRQFLRARSSCRYSKGQWSECVNGIQTKILTPRPNNDPTCSSVIENTRTCGDGPVTTPAPPPPPPHPETTTPSPLPPPTPQESCGVSIINPAAMEPVRAFTDPQYIVGGIDTQECEYRWMALLHIGGYLCGGSIINERYILTAAHCLRKQRASRTTAFLGVYDSRDLSRGVQAIGASQLIVHSQYNWRTNENDIGLIKLETPITFNDCVGPICVPATNQAWTTGDRCTVAGWGTTSEGGSLAAHLQEVTVSLWTPQDCRDEFPANSNLVHDSTVCAGEAIGGKDACQGDSGGPLMCGSGGSWFVTGIVSTGYGCAQAGLPGVYTNVSDFTDWINTNTV